MKFQIFVFFLSALVTQVLCQTSIELGPEDPAQLFTVQIRNFTFPTVENATFRCTGTIFDRRHVVTAASCVDPDSNNMIVAYGSVNKTWTAESGSFEFLEWVRPHPQFQANNPRANNVAVLRLRHELSARLQPRLLSEIPSNGDRCNLFGWGQRSTSPILRRANLRVENATSCAGQHPQIFCGNLFDGSECGGYLGGPLICDDVSMALAGILVVDEFCANTPQGQFHSIGDFESWIREVSAGVTTKDSIISALVVAAFMKLM